MKTKKELKKIYNQLKPKIGVYKITNTVNHKVYIDSSVNLDKIWNRHQVELKFGNHRNTALQQDWNTYGEANFTYEILSELKQEDDTKTDYAQEAKKLAKMFIDELQPFGDKGYH